MTEYIKIIKIQPGKDKPLEKDIKDKIEIRYIDTKINYV